MTKPEKHSPEPWRVTRQNGSCVYIGTKTGMTIATFGGYGTLQSQKDARRVIDLVNALTGIEINDIRKWARAHRLKQKRHRKKMELEERRT